MCQIYYYQINGLLKFAEVDDWEKGCDPDTTQHVDVDLKFHDTTKEGLIKQVADFLGVDSDGIEKNACDEKGRVDFSLMETDKAYRPSKNEIARWEKGQLRLWAVTYTGYVEKVSLVTL